MSLDVSFVSIYFINRLFPGASAESSDPGGKSYLEFSPVCQNQPEGSGLYNKVLTPQK